MYKTEFFTLVTMVGEGTSLDLWEHWADLCEENRKMHLINPDWL